MGLWPCVRFIYYKVGVNRKQTQWHAKKSKSGTQNRPQVHAIGRRNFHENRKIDPEIIDVVKDVIDVIDDFTRFE